MRQTLSTLLFAFLLASLGIADEWPGWRGSSGQGHAARRTSP
jgi:hypothetical protein